MKLTATHLPPTRQKPRPSDSLTAWEIDALCAYLLDLHPEMQTPLTRDLPSIACKLYNHPINVYGEE